MSELLPMLREILDPTIARNAIADIEYAVNILDALDFQPACEGTTHDAGTEGHHVDAPAEWLVLSACGGSGQLCDPRVQWLLGFPRLTCGCCGEIHRIETYRFVRLDQRTNP